MRTWRREYPDHSVALIMQAPDGFVVVFLEAGEDTGLVRITHSLEQAQAVADHFAGARPDPTQWTER